MSLTELVQHYLGSEIPRDTDLVGATANATQKLRRIIEREGDWEGERRQPYYLAQLIAEEIQAQSFAGRTKAECRAGVSDLHKAV